jgi:K+-transporting ATPase ATPase A chain
MSGMGLLQIVIYFAVLTALAVPLGGFMARAYSGQPTFLSPVLGPVERLLYRATGVKVDDDMHWKRYALAALVFNLLGALAVYALQRLQGMLPLNPMELGAVSPDSSFNTAMSFATNTNWQGYGGESTMSYLSQMLGLNVQNFLSAATGMAVLVAFIRGFVRKQSGGIGNFWVDLTRSTLYVLLPLSFVVALILVSQGVVQNLQGGRRPGCSRVWSPRPRTGARKEKTSPRRASAGPAARRSPSSSWAPTAAVSSTSTRRTRTRTRRRSRISSRCCRSC